MQIVIGNNDLYVLFKSQNKLISRQIEINKYTKKSLEFTIDFANSDNCLSL